MIENNRLKEWADSHYKEILLTLKEEHDFNITDFKYIGELDHLSDRSYCRVLVYYGDMVRKGCLVLVDEGDNIISVDRVSCMTDTQSDGF